MMDQVVGRIEFWNTREGNALSVLQEALVDKTMWMMEVMRKEEQIDELRKELDKLKGEYIGCKEPRKLGNRVVSKKRKLR